MQLTAKQEITADWKAHFEVPNHTYIFNKATGKCVAYVSAKTNQLIVLRTPIKIDERFRKFKSVPITAEMQGALK